VHFHKSKNIQKVRAALFDYFSTKKEDTLSASSFEVRISQKED